MAISWKLKTFLFKKHDLRSATDVQKTIKLKTGVIVSVQNICNYLNVKPKSLRLETIEILCTTFDCKLSDFCQVTPNKKVDVKEKKLSYKNTPLSKRGVQSFPDPVDY